jgi:hypothetical protein
MKLSVLTLFILMCAYGLLNAQDKAQYVPRLPQKIMSNEWYKNQSDLWEKEIKNNPQNTTAWFNYFKASR